jgi:hypothetical protein
MAIKIINRDEAINYKLDAEIQQYKKMELEIMDQVKKAISYLTDLDYLYELQDYIEDLIREWQDEELEEEDYEDEED